MNNILAPSSLNHPFGTDELGRDLFSCLLYGAALSLFIGLSVVIISFVLGCFLGLVAGLAGGFVDSCIMFLVDIFLAFPGLLLAITFAAFFHNGLVILILVLSLVNWVEYTRLIRGEVMKYKNKEFIQASICFNASFFHIIRFHMIPLVRPLAVVQFFLSLSGIIMAESSLNFLGIGLENGLPTLGQMISSGRDYLFDTPRLFIAPGLTLFFIILSFHFIGEGLRKKFSTFLS